jgi:hypothetical protein
VVPANILLFDSDVGIGELDAGPLLLVGEVATAEDEIFAEVKGGTAVPDDAVPGSAVPGNAVLFNAGVGNGGASVELLRLALLLLDGEVVIAEAELFKDATGVTAVLDNVVSGKALLFDADVGSGGVDVELLPLPLDEEAATVEEVMFPDVKGGTAVPGNAVLGKAVPGNAVLFNAGVGNGGIVLDTGDVPLEGTGSGLLPDGEAATVEVFEEIKGGVAVPGNAVLFDVGTGKGGLEPDPTGVGKPLGGIGVEILPPLPDVEGTIDEKELFVDVKEGTAVPGTPVPGNAVLFDADVGNGGEELEAGDPPLEAKGIELFPDDEATIPEADAFVDVNGGTAVPGNAVPGKAVLFDADVGNGGEELEAGDTPLEERGTELFPDGEVAISEEETFTDPTEVTAVPGNALLFDGDVGNGGIIEEPEATDVGNPPEGTGNELLPILPDDEASIAEETFDDATGVTAVPLTAVPVPAVPDNAVPFEIGVGNGRMVVEPEARDVWMPLEGTSVELLPLLLDDEAIIPEEELFKNIGDEVPVAEELPDDSVAEAVELIDDAVAEIEELTMDEVVDTDGAAKEELFESEAGDGVSEADELVKDEVADIKEVAEREVSEVELVRDAVAETDEVAEMEVSEVELADDAVTETDELAKDAVAETDEVAEMEVSEVELADDAVAETDELAEDAVGEADEAAEVEISEVALAEDSVAEADELVKDNVSEADSVNEDVVELPYEVGVVRIKVVVTVLTALTVTWFVLTAFVSLTPLRVKVYQYQQALQILKGIYYVVWTTNY